MNPFPNRIFLNRLPAVFFAILLFGECLYPEMVCAAPNAESAGRVVSLNGRASIRGGAVKVGDAVHEADVIKTEPGGGVKLLMRDRTVVDIASDSSFRIREYQTNKAGERKVALELDFGSVRASVSKKLDQKSNFTIRTKSSVLAVRGTEFSASWRMVDGKAQEKVTVSQGNVAVTPSFGTGKSISVGEGKQLTTSGVIKDDRVVASENTKESGVKLVALAPKEAERTVASNSVEDKTFTKSVDLSSGGDSGGGGRQAGEATVSSVAVATGAKEMPRQRGPRSDGIEGRGDRGEKGEKGDKREGGVAANDVPGGTGIPGGSHRPGGDIPGQITTPDTPTAATVTVGVKVSFP